MSDTAINDVEHLACDVLVIGAGGAGLRAAVEARLAGKSVIVISSEMPEVIGLATRVMVMASGRIVGEVEGEAISEQTIVRYAMGMTNQKASA